MFRARLLAPRLSRSCSCSSNGEQSQGQKQRYALVSPPDQASNIVHIKLPPPSNAEEEALLKLHDEVQSFNHSFWAQHNKEFKERKAQFMAAVLSERTGEDPGRVTADELSVFYKQFLNDKYHVHMKYLRRWAWLNCQLTLALLAVRVKNVCRAILQR